MAVRLDPWQNIVGVSWGNNGPITHVVISLSVTTMSFETQSAANLDGDGDYYSFEVPFPDFYDGYTSTINYRVSLNTMAIGWNGTTWASLGLVGTSLDSSRIVKVLGFEPGLKVANPPSWKVFSPNGINGSIVDPNESINRALRFTIAASGPPGEDRVPVYLSSGSYYDPLLTTLKCECYAVLGSGATRKVRYYGPPPEIPPDPPYAHYLTGVTSSFSDVSSDTQTAELLTGVTLKYGDVFCTLRSVFTPTSNVTVTGPGVSSTQNMPRTANVLFEVPT